MEIVARNQTIWKFSWENLEFRFYVILDCWTSGRAMDLASTEPPTEMSTRGTSWEAKTASVQRWQTNHIHMNYCLEFLTAANFSRRNGLSRRTQAEFH